MVKRYQCGEYNPAPKYHDEKRKSPPYSAVDCEGRRMQGLDGAYWVSELKGKAVRWTRIPNYSEKLKSRAPKRSKARKSRAPKRSKARKSRAPKRSKH